MTTVEGVNRRKYNLVALLVELLYDKTLLQYSEHSICRACALIYSGLYSDSSDHG